jgi:hypothetical protein
MDTKLTELIAKITRGLQDIFDVVMRVKTRAISMPNIYSLVFAQLDAQTQQDGTWRALIDVYLDGADMFAVVGVNGMLYKSMLDVSGGGVALGEMQQVEVDYKPVARGLTIHRQTDGKYRWFAFPAATAVLNRSGELDTRELFKNFVARIEGGAPYPFLSFYHVGEQIVLGQADFAAVEGYEYLLSGTFAEDPLSQAVRKAIQNEPGYWGTSIGYKYQPETVERVAITDGITIPAYTDGINHEVSILAERVAACLYTGIYVPEGVNRMNKQTKDALLKVAGSDPEVLAIVDDLETKVDTINTEINQPGVIRRENDPVAEPAPAEVAPVEAPAPVAPEHEFVMDDTVIQELSNRVVDALTSGKFAELITAAVNEKIATSEQAIASLSDTVTKLTARIAALEKPVEETVKQVIQDMPRNQTKVAYRPTQTRQAEQPEEKTISLQDIAAATLANIKK